MKFSNEDFFRKYDQICSFPRIWSRLLKKSLMKNFIFCAVYETSCKKGVVYDNEVKFNQLLMD